MKLLIIGCIMIIIMVHPVFANDATLNLVDPNAVNSFDPTLRVQGKSDNSTNPTVKVPILPCVATAAAPTYTNGNIVPCSLDLSGSIRTTSGGGSVTANQGTPNSIANAWPIQICDTVDCANVTSGRLEVDGSGVTQPISQASYTATTVTGTITSLGGTVVVTNTENASGMTLQLSGTYTATLIPEGSNDGGVTYHAITAAPIQGLTARVTGFSGNGMWMIATAGFTHVRVRASAYSSGTAIVTWRTTSLDSNYELVYVVGSVSVTGSVNVSSISSNVNVVGFNIDGGLYFSGFTDLFPSGFVRDDSAVDCADQSVCIARMTPEKAVMVNLRNNSGTEIGTTSTPVSIDVRQIAGTTTVNGGLAGSQSIGGTAASNATITQNPVLIGAEVLSTQPSAASTGNQRRLIAALDGALYVRPGGPVPWTCSLDAVGTTLTQCQASPGAGLRLYLTDILAQSTTTTASQFSLQYGTGANCGTGTTAFLPSSTTTSRFAYGSNSEFSPAAIHFTTPIAPPSNNAICIVTASGTNTGVFQLIGYTAP